MEECFEGSQQHNLGSMGREGGKGGEGKEGGGRRDVERERR